MSFPGFISAPVAEIAALDVPWPGYGDSYWREAPPGAQMDVVVAEAAPVTTRALLGGDARNRIGVDVDDCSGIVQCDLLLGGAWSVVLVDSLEAHPCATLPSGEAVGGGRLHSFMAGEQDGHLLLHAHDPDDDDQAILGRAMTRPLAPAGISGECLFTNLYLVVESSTSGWVRVTPVVNGDVLTAEAHVLPLQGDGTERHENRFEIALTQAYDPGGGEVARAGIRGTWFAALIELRDCWGCGRAVLSGFDLEYEVVSESLPFTSYALRPFELLARQQPIRWFLGTGDATGRLLEGGVGNDDAGTPFDARAQTRPLAPAGPGGECMFVNLYLVVERANAQNFTLELVPIVDDEELDTYELVLEGVAQPVEEVHEIPLSVPYLVDGLEVARNAPRGAWFSVRVQNGSAVPPEIHIWEGFELEYEVVSESEVAI